MNLGMPLMMKKSVRALITLWAFSFLFSFNVQTFRGIFIHYIQTLESLPVFRPMVNKVKSLFHIDLRLQLFSFTIFRYIHLKPEYKITG